MKLITDFFNCSIRHPAYCISMAIIVSALFILLYSFYLQIFPLKVMEVYSAKVVHSEFKAGDQLEYVLDWCSFGDYQITVQPRLRNDYVRTLPSYTTTIPEDGCFKSRLNTVKIPDETETGTYTLQVDITIKVNVLRTENVHFETDRFEVVK